MPELELSDTCRLRPVEEGDAEELYALVVANRDYLSPWMPWAAEQTLAGTIAFIRAASRQLAENDGFQAAIVCGGRIRGVAGYHAVAWQDRATTIGYWIAEDAQGHGLATGATRVLVDHAFGTWSLHRVEIRAAVGNRRSRAIPERLGFREEGVLREAERVGERFHDLVVYSLLDREWNGSAELAAR